MPTICFDCLTMEWKRWYADINAERLRLVPIGEKPCDFYCREEADGGPTARGLGFRFWE